MKDAMFNNSNEVLSESHTNLVYKMLHNQIQKVIESHHRLCETKKPSQSQSYTKFSNDFFQMLETTFVPTVIKNFNEIKQSPRQLLNEIVDNLRLIFNNIQWIITKEQNKLIKKKYEKQEVRHQKQTLCRKCDSIIAGKQIEYQKINIQYAQFEDPYNLFALGLTEFQDGTDFMPNNIDYHSESSLYQIQIQGHIESIKKRIIKRTNQITQILNSFEKYYIEVTNKEIENNQKQKQRRRQSLNTYKSFDACFREIIYIISQKLEQVINKIKVMKDGNNEKSQGVQVDLVQQQIDHHIEKYHQLEKQLCKKKKQIFEVMDQKTSLLLEINNFEIQTGHLKKQIDETKAASEAIKCNFQSEKYEHKKTSSKLSEALEENKKLLQKIEALIYNSNLAEDDDKIRDSQKKNSTLKPVKNKRSEKRIMNKRHDDFGSEIYKQMKNKNYAENRLNEDMHSSQMLQNIECEPHNNYTIDVYPSNNKSRKSKIMKSLRGSRVSSIDEDNKQSSLAPQKSKTIQRSSIFKNQREQIADIIKEEEGQIKRKQLSRKGSVDLGHKVFRDTRKQYTKHQLLKLQNNKTIQQSKVQTEQYDKHKKESEYKQNLPSIKEKLSTIKNQSSSNNFSKNKSSRQNNSQLDGQQLRKLRKQRTSMPIKNRFNEIYSINYPRFSKKGGKKYLDCVQNEDYKQSLNVTQSNEKDEANQFTKSSHRDMSREKMIHPMKTFMASYDNRGKKVSEFNKTLGAILVERSKFENTLNSSIGEHYNFASTDSFHKMNQVKVQKIFNMEDLNNLYFSVEGALQHEKSKKRNFKQVEQNVSKLKLSMKLLTLIASLHSFNQSLYQAIKNFLVAPFQTVVSQHNYVLITKSGVNETKIREAINKVFWLHRYCSGEVCPHLKLFIERIEEMLMSEKLE